MFDKKNHVSQTCEIQSQTNDVVIGNIPGLTLGDDKSGGSEPSPQSTKRSPRSPETNNNRNYASSQ